MDASKLLSVNDIYLIITGIAMGTFARLITLKVDFRQIPTYPSAYFNNIVLGLIASALGAIAVPAILSQDFTAVTFLTLAVQQFRESRTTEQESMGKLEGSSYVQRGNAYIDGVSKTFESRSYLCLVTALSTVLAMKIANLPQRLYSELTGVVAGGIVMALCYFFTKGQTIGNVCTVQLGKIEVRESELYVDNMFVSNYVGADRARTMILNEGIAAVLTPKNPADRVTLENLGQRQAVLYEAIRALGVKRYKFMKRDFPTGRVIIVFVPIMRDPNVLLQAIKSTPILENSRKANKVMKN